MTNSAFRIIASISLLAAIGAGFAAQAQDRTLSASNSAAILVTDTTAPCESQVWPAFAADCLLTIDGKPLERKFRTVVAF